MPTHVALLRGINVGKAKRIAMADLRKVVEGLGYSDVRTLLNSGNVVFTAGAAKADHSARIEKVIVSKLGVSSLVTVLTAAELDAIVRENPLMKHTDQPSRFLVMVLRNPAAKKLAAPLAKQKWSPDAVEVGTRVVYVWCAQGLLDSKPAQALIKALGDQQTARNWATITKLHAMAAGE